MPDLLLEKQAIRFAQEENAFGQPVDAEPAWYGGFGRRGSGVAALAGALFFAMRANLAADHAFANGIVRTAAVKNLHRVAMGWGLGFTVLQLGSFLAFAFVLRSCYRLRSAVCFVLGAGAVMAGDALELLGVLIWLRVTLGAG